MTNINSLCPDNITEIMEFADDRMKLLEEVKRLKMDLAKSEFFISCWREETKLRMKDQVVVWCQMNEWWEIILSQKKLK